MAMRLYHATTDEAAEAIKREGFRDAEGTYMTTESHHGVWVSDSLLGVNEGVKDEAVVALDIPESVVVDYEWIEERKGYREFLVPAAVLNQYPPEFLEGGAE